MNGLDQTQTCGKLSLTVAPALTCMLPIMSLICQAAPLLLGARWHQLHCPLGLRLGASQDTQADISSHIHVHQACQDTDKVRSDTDQIRSDQTRNRSDQARHRSGVTYVCRPAASLVSLGLPWLESWWSPRPMCAVGILIRWSSCRSVQCNAIMLWSVDSLDSQQNKWSQY